MMDGGRERLAWVDAAKGAAILMVVAFHAFQAARETGAVPDVALTVIGALSNVCMPVFFLASGVLAAPLMERPWGAVLRGRLGPLAALLVLWSVLGFLVNLAIPLHPEADGSPPGPWEVLWHPMGNLWFLHALIAFTVLGRVAASAGGRRRLAAALLWVALAALAAWSGDATIRNLAQYAPFFLGGFLFAPAITGLARRPGELATMAAAAVAVLVASAALGLSGRIETAVGNVFGTALALPVLVALRAVPGLSRPFEAAGRRSLALFLGHQPAIAMAFAWMPLGWASPTELWVLLTTVAIAGALALERAARATGLGWLYGASRAGPAPFAPAFPPPSGWSATRARRS